jgi:hypothetical protein
MGWIKRNLFFVVGGVLALGLLGGAGFFIWQGWSLNSDASVKLNEIYGKLQELAQSPLQPGNNKVNNTEEAKAQEKQVLDWIASAGKYFQPIPAVPPGATVPSAAYAEALRQTIDLLQHEAESASVTLPPKYDFSFSAQRSLVRFAPGSLEPLAAQLGEVKAISEILFAARVNDLDSIQRVRVSDDDTAGLQSDYIDQRPITNDLAIITPYVVTFRCFTPELARVVSGFATSPNPFIVKSVTVQPASATTNPEGTGEAAPNPYPAGMDPRYADPRYMDPRYRRGPMPGMVPNPDQPQAGQPAAKGGLQTVLKEQLLHITLEVEIVKLLPK